VSLSGFVSLSACTLLRSGGLGACRGLCAGKLHCGRSAARRAMVNPLQWRFEWRNAAYLVFSFR